MTTVFSPAWSEEFGIAEGSSPRTFVTRHDLDAEGAAMPQAHVLRRAFDLLKLDGVLCSDTAPLVYFKCVSRIGTADIPKVHRRFWNHGGAPILVVIAPDTVQVYSGLSRPVAQPHSDGRLPSLVTTIDRASSALRKFLPAVESGEFFRRHSRSFNPAARVDQDLLDNLVNTRNRLAEVGAKSKRETPEVLDALLCRLVFTCYLFDRKVIGPSYLQDLNLRGVTHLRDLLGLRPRSKAKTALYRLFAQLAKDFNGDLFADDLAAEGRLVSEAHLGVVEDFFHATDVASGQRFFWPYDFGVIPIEIISAIYEHFLKQTEKDNGAFYTRRFLVELVLDLVLTRQPSLLGHRYLDPACGSGIFLVGLFNRMAEEWRRSNPRARNERRARELMELLRSSISGVDVTSTACRITAFSLYLAYLDQLTPRDIRHLQAKGSALPRLVGHLDQPKGGVSDAVIWCGDFFREDAPYPSDVDLVVGNPPWGSLATEGSPAAEWCRRRDYPIPDNQIATAFMWKAAEHAGNIGRVCLLLPYGVLFNHSRTALSFQKAFIKQHALDRVLNLTDYQKFLFKEARHPALVVSYRREPPGEDHTTEYWVPKADWKVAKAEAIEVSQHDRSTLTIKSILLDLDGADAPQIWKRMAWASTRDRRLLTRLAEFPRLRDRVRQSRDRKPGKPWLIAEGYQPLGENDDPARAAILQLPSGSFIKATSPQLQLFLLEDECIQRRSKRIKVRARSNKGVDVFRAPHVLVAQGFRSVAFADFDVSFQHALRGITGPRTDRQLLIFLAAYMRSALAQYFLFHTSSNWGAGRQKVHVEELMRLPFPTPDTMNDPERAQQIVNHVSRVVLSAARNAQDVLADRDSLVKGAQAQIEPLIFEYFDILPSEQILVKDTIQVSIPSFRPNPNRRTVPAIDCSSPGERSRYTERLCCTLNAWGQGPESQVVGSAVASQDTGIGLVVLEKGRRRMSDLSRVTEGGLLPALDRLREAVALKMNTFELARGVKVFDGNRLYIVKPLTRRHWTETAALNDADEIAGSILMQAAGDAT